MSSSSVYPKEWKRHIQMVSSETKVFILVVRILNMQMAQSEEYGSIMIVIPYINLDVKRVNWCKGDCHSIIIFVASKTHPNRSSLRPWRTDRWRREISHVCRVTTFLSITNHFVIPFAMHSYTSVNTGENCRHQQRELPVSYHRIDWRIRIYHWRPWIMMIMMMSV